MTEQALCPGSGQRPVEMVILDVGPWDPPGTCPECGRSMGLKWWCLPDHKAKP